MRKRTHAEPQTDWLAEFGQEIPTPEGTKPEAIKIVHVSSGGDDWLAAFAVEEKHPTLIAARPAPVPPPSSFADLPDETEWPPMRGSSLDRPGVFAVALVCVSLAAVLVLVVSPAGAIDDPIARAARAAAGPMVTSFERSEPRLRVPFMEEVLGFRSWFSSNLPGPIGQLAERAGLEAVKPLSARYLRPEFYAQQRRVPPAVRRADVVASNALPLGALTSAQPLVTVAFPTATSVAEHFVPPPGIVERRPESIVTVSSLAPPPPSSSPAPVRVSEVDPSATDRGAIESVLARYRQAFDSLDASGVDAFWPGVNARTLARAFEQLDEQAFRFDRCNIDVSGDRADAACSGTASYIPKVGSKALREESRVWTFRMQRARSGWVIDRVESRAGNNPK